MCRWLLCCPLPLLTVWLTVLVSMFSPSPPPPPPHKHTFNPTSFSFQIWILCQNSLTRKLKIRGVGFVLKKLFAHFEMLIVSHALHCVNGPYLYSFSFDSLVNCLVSVLDKHISVKQLMSIRNLKNDSLLIICVLQCTRLSKKGPCCI